MKTNKYADLIKFGLKQKTLMTLSESSINTLHKNLIEGKKDICPKCKMKNCKCDHSKKKETKEQNNTPANTVVNKTSQEVTIPNGGAFAIPQGKKAEALSVGGQTKVIISSGKEEDGKEIKPTKKKSTKYSGVNPFAVCHAQLGPKKTRKFERCVMAVKQSIKEGKDPFAVLLENKILSLLETHLQPKMKKGDLMNLVSKKSMDLPVGKIGGMGGSVSENTKEAPTKPEKGTPGTREKPTTKPDKDTPYKPKTVPAPKAHHKKHETKEFVMDAPAPTKKPKENPGTREKPTTKPEKGNPYLPKTIPAPKANMPRWMSFESIGIKLKK
jgi:hypothetical protein